MNNNPVPASCRDLLPKAVLKREYTDFQVVENLGFEPDGEGEHLWLEIRKTGLNTRDVLEALARAFKVHEKNVGYSGLKDKHAVTTQWVSIPYPIAEAPPAVADVIPDLEGVEILQLTRSLKKLRRGAHRSNSFVVRLHEIDGDPQEIERRLETIVSIGFPNYFGAQRFGIDGRNIDNARSMFTGKRKLTRFKRSMYLSAARSWLFNQVLARRIECDDWLKVLPGEVCMLDGSNSVFHCEVPDADSQRRLDEKDIHTTGPLHGSGESMATDVVRALELSCIEQEEVIANGLVKAGLKTERRALRAVAHELQWQWLDGQTLELSFGLQRGVYATSLLNELVELKQAEYSS